MPSPARRPAPRLLTAPLLLLLLRPRSAAFAPLPALPPGACCCYALELRHRAEEGTSLLLLAALISEVAAGSDPSSAQQVLFISPFRLSV